MPQATTSPDVRRSRQSLARSRPTQTADLVFDSFFGGGVAGSTIALFFLAIDVMAGHPLYTPSMMGTALFTDARPETISVIRHDMVALFSIVHFAAFAAFAGSISYWARRASVVGAHPMVIAAIAFSLLTVLILVADWVFMSGGAVRTLGYGQVLLANALTGIALALFVKWSHRPGRYGGEVTT